MGTTNANVANASGNVTASSDGGRPIVAGGVTRGYLSPKLIELGQKVVVLGDSFAFQCNDGSGPGGLTFTRSAGVVTVTGATSHKFYPGALISVVGLSPSSDEVQRVPVTAYLSSSSFSYPSAGADGVLTERSTNSGTVINLQNYQSAGFWAHFNRKTAGAYTLVNNAGFPGATTDIIASKVSTWVAPYYPDRVIYLAGYNDITAGRTVAQTVQSIKDSVDAYPAALWDIFSTFPFNSGSANNTAANLRTLNKYYAALKAAFISYPNVRIHNSLKIAGQTTGLATTGFIGSDNIHPTPRCMYECAKYLAALDSVFQTPIDLPITALDTIGNDASSKNVIDNPLMTGSGGSAMTNCTGTVPTGGSGALTGTGASGVSSVSARSDGFGNDWILTYTPANADNVLRMSLSGLNARFTSGSTIDRISCKVSVSGVVAGNIKQMELAMVWIADGVTYASSVQEASGNAATIAGFQQDDVTDLVFCMRNVPVPVFTSLTTARLDFTIAHLASGTQVVAKWGQVQITLA